MAKIEWQRDGAVAVVTMKDGQNRHNPAFVEQMLATLAEVRADDSLRALVLTSADGKSWSQGADLEWLQARLQQGDSQAIKNFLFGINELLIAILTFGLPVFAAITGHVVGNGLILACACDFRVMRADRGYAVIPGVDLGLYLLPGMLAVLRKAIPHQLLAEMILSGGRYDGTTLAQHQVVKEAVRGREPVLARALSLARGFDKSPAVFGETKRRLHADILQVMNERDPITIENLEVNPP